MADGSSSRHEDAIDVSVVVATWNCGKFIERAICSALGQSGISIEIIVVDDSSTDDTEQVILKLSDHRIRYFRNIEQLGPSLSRNRALATARGTWVAVLDADDAMKTGRLERMIQIAGDLDLDCVLDQVTAVDEAGELLDSFVDSVSAPAQIGTTEYIESNILFKNAGLGYLKPLIRRSVLVSNGIEYRADMRVGEDFALICDLLLSGARVGLSSSPDYIYTRRRTSISHRIRIDDLKAMMAFDDIMLQHSMADIDINFRDAVVRHRAALEKLSALTTLVDHFHGGRHVQFFLAVIRQPGSFQFLFWILQTRLLRVMNYVRSVFQQARLTSARNELP